MLRSATCRLLPSSRSSFTSSRLSSISSVLPSTFSRSLRTSRPRLADESPAAGRSSSSTSSSSGPVLNVRFVTPNETILNNTAVYMVTVPAVTGVMGILADHAPTIAQLQPGVVTVHTADINDITHRLFVSGGFAVINNESSASITAVEAIRLEDLDVAQARQGLTDAQGQLAKAGGEKEKAEAQVGVEVLEAVIAALEQTKQ